jgi:hypothetical protein
MIFPLLLVGFGVAGLIAVLVSSDDPPDYQPDIPPELRAPGSTGYRRIDAMLPQLKDAALRSGIPLGLLIGWIAKESAGKLGDLTKLDERGVFQIHPEESGSLGLDHQRLSTDLEYSIAAGILLIKRYMSKAAALDIAPAGSDYFYRLVKLFHTMGSGATSKIVAGAKAAGEAGSWEALRNHAVTNNQKYLSLVKHSPAKWFPLVEEVARVGAPFGFGSDMTVAGLDSPSGHVYTDIPDPLALLPRYRKQG